MDLPAHTLPKYDENSRKNALFHYTTADGLLGILQNKEIWSTAYYCANDVSELRAGKDVLTSIFRLKTHQMIQEADPRVNTFRMRGVDIREYADRFEDWILGAALNFFCVYISCFCKHSKEKDFQNGLLSQWRGYGPDGGYALQFSRERLEECAIQANKRLNLNYEIQDVHYTPKNFLKDRVTEHSETFISAYMEHLDMLANDILETRTIRSPIAGLGGGPLESILEYIIYTKNEHFSEENECRMCVVEPVSSESEVLPVDYFNRSGLIVPFTRTPQEFNILECIDWIIVGPGPRIRNRFNSVSQMVRKIGLNVKVRPSHIPFVRV